MKKNYNEDVRNSILKTTIDAKKSKLSEYFKTLSSDRFAKEYDVGKDWIVGPFEKVEELTYHKKSSWKDPLNVDWSCGAIHNCSLLTHEDKLYMFYRANPSIESLSSRIGIAVYEEGKGWKDYEGNPVIYSTFENENLSCDDPKIYKVDDKYVLFYQSCFKPTQKDIELYSDKNYLVTEVAVDINVAISYDLFHWEKKGSIIPREITHLWAKAAVIPKSPDGRALKINGKYMIFISEGCGGKQVVGYSDDMLNWDFQYEQFLDVSDIGQLFEVACCITDFEQNDNLILDFFYSDGSGICRAAQALYNKNEPTKQLDINKGGSLSWGGMIKYKGNWLYAQGWDAPVGEPVMYFYKSI